MRELAFAGLVALVFGLGSFYATREMGPFQVANLGFAAAALLAALGLGARRLRAAGGPQARRVLARGVAGIAAACALAVLLERGAALARVDLDWTGEGRFELAAATLGACRELARQGLTATLFADPADRRVRQTRLLLRALARDCPLEVRERRLDPEAGLAEEDAELPSNGVLLEAAGGVELVERPLEGALYEALYRLREPRGGTLAWLRGEGEGDPEDPGPGGFSGLAAALATEGYQVLGLLPAALADVPGEVRAVLAIAPERRLPEPALGALRRFLASGGRLLALLEPGRETGLEELLAEWGLASPLAAVVDPTSARASGPALELGIAATRFETHPATTGLGANRAAFFPGARAFALHKPDPDDALVRLVYASPGSWLAEGAALGALREGRLEAPDGARTDFFAIAAAGRYRRAGGEARILAFGDAGFASNRHLRSLYNLDLVLNGVHWLLEREPEITLRPKLRTAIQFPLPQTRTLTALYGVGILVPEVLLIAGGLAWLRRDR